MVIPNTFAGAKLLISYQTTKQKGKKPMLMTGERPKNSPLSATTSKDDDKN